MCQELEGELTVSVGSEGKVLRALSSHPYILLELFSNLHLVNV